MTRRGNQPGPVLFAVVDRAEGATDLHFAPVARAGIYVSDLQRTAHSRRWFHSRQRRIACALDNASHPEDLAKPSHRRYSAARRSSSTATRSLSILVNTLRATTSSSAISGEAIE